MNGTLTPPPPPPPPDASLYTVSIAAGVRFVYVTRNKDKSTFFIEPFYVDVPKDTAAH